MLGPMDVAATAPGAGIAPWLVLGVVLGVVLGTLLGAALAALLARAAGHRSSRRRAPAPAPFRDDLPGFREAPPGFPGARRPPTTGWVALAPLPPPAAPAREDRPLPVLAGLAGAVLLLIGAAALVAGLSPGRAAADRPARPADRSPDLAAEASFAGLVLERRAVGVTVTTPRLRLADGRAEVTLPAWNCLADEAPADPEAAGCARTPTQYAELAGPALDLQRDGDTVRVSGRFPTMTRPNGGPPEETGRAYDLAFTLRPDGDGGTTGEVRLGDDTAPVIEPATGPAPPG
jgi:hypothetical protein